MREPRRVVRAPFYTYTGLKSTQEDELKKRGELFDVFPAYEGGRVKMAYADDIACWQTWRDARQAGETTLSWLEWKEDQEAKAEQAKAEQETVE